MDTNDKTKCCDKCSGTVRDENQFGRDYGCLKEDCSCHVPPPLETGGEDEELFGRYRGKLWSKAIQIAMTSPFPEVSMMHVLNRVKQKVEKDILNEILGMKRVAINEKEAISPMGIVSISQGDGHTPPPTYNIRNLQYVKVFDIQKYAEDNDISLSEPLEKE